MENERLKAGQLFFNRLFFFVLIAIFIFSMAYEFNKSNGNNVIVGTQKPEPDKNLKISAYLISHHFVDEYLISPSTSDYPWYDESYVQDEGNNIFIAHSYVDAQNSFGAKLRNNWLCQLKYKSGDRNDFRNWEALEIDIDYKVYYLKEKTSVSTDKIDIDSISQARFPMKHPFVFKSYYSKSAFSVNPNPL